MSLTLPRRLVVALGIIWSASPASAFAQVAETVGVRALGMGGAFVAVASDSSATWWNPAGLAAGPFIDIAISKALTDVGDGLPARRERTSGFSLGTPPLGISYYRFQVTDIRPFDPTGTDAAGRQADQAEVPLRSLTARELGVTLVHSIVPGVHAGTTLRYVRGTLRTGLGDVQRSAGDLLHDGEELEGGDGQGQFDMDIGILAVKSGLRAGVVVRHLREPEFTGGGDTMRLPRQARLGVAFDGGAASGPPLVLSFDADVLRVTTATGERRNVAFGAERWLLNKRLGLRGGGRMNTLGRRERAGTAGVSVAARAGLYLEAYGVRGRAADDRGWGAAARVSF